MRRPLVLAGLAALTTLVAPALAHFPFILAVAGHARLVLSETLEPDPAVGIEPLAGARLSLRDADGQDTHLELKPMDDWMEITLPGTGEGGTRLIHGEVDLGVQQRGQTPHLLVYYPKAIIGDPFDPKTVVGNSAPVELVPVHSSGGLRLRLLVAGKLAPASPIKVIAPDGTQAELTTDAEGLTTELTTPGRYGAWARNWLDQEGERDGKHYGQVRRYATLVLDLAAPTAAKTYLNSDGFRALAQAPLPRPVASFGAVSVGDWLYVYGGHAATRHQYSTASVSGRLSRLDLREPGAEWEELPGGVPVQGMNLATFGGKVYRIGGMEPRNGPDQPGDNYSLAEAAAFDPATNLWTTLPPLPRPRSSHDVVVVGDTLMVTGGWSIQGRGSTPAWLDTLDMVDLSSPGAAWESIPQPFQRRALTAAAVGPDVFVIGGFDGTDTASGSVEIFHSAQRTWSRGPEIPGGGANGFAPAACTHDGSLYLSLGTGEMFRLRRDWTAWEPVATTTPRIVHRLVAHGPQILVLGGARDAKMTDLVEAVTLPTGPAAPLATIVQHTPPRAKKRDPAADRLASSMSEIDEISDRLRRIEKASWAAPSEPDRAPAAEARRLVEIVKALEQDDGVKARPAEFLTLLKASESRMETLRTLAEEKAGSAKLSSQLRLVFASCKDCHRAYRD